MSAPRNDIHGAEWLVLMLIVLSLGVAAYTARAVEDRANAKPTTMSASKVPCASSRH